jgi:hypothetical protein
MFASVSRAPQRIVTAAGRVGTAVADGRVATAVAEGCPGVAAGAQAAIVRTAANIPAVMWI